MTRTNRGVACAKLSVLKMGVLEDAFLIDCRKHEAGGRRKCEKSGFSVLSRCSMVEMYNIKELTIIRFIKY